MTREKPCSNSRLFTAHDPTHGSVQDLFERLAVRFGAVRFGSVRFGSVRFGSVRFGSVRLVSVRFGSIRVGSGRVESGRVGFCIRRQRPCVETLSRRYQWRSVSEI